MLAFVSRKSQFLLIAGHIIECFDNTLYGFFAVMLGPLFFPSYSAHASTLASYGVFLAGFIARPLGAFFFGYLGDTQGRRKILIYSMALAGIPTLIIGLLPTYDVIGFAAPCILVFCRLAQGFFIGGEFVGANLYISENSIPGDLGKGTGILIFSGVMGAILATLFGALVTLECMPSWCWRLPFLIGGISAYSIYAMRKQMMETAEFSKLDKDKNSTFNPLKNVIKEYKREIFTSCLIAGLTIVPLYCTTILGNKIFKEMGYTSSECMLFNFFGMLVNGFSILYFGYIADKIGFYRQILLGTFLTILIALPSFYLINNKFSSCWEILSFIFLLTAVGGIINGCAMPYIASYFPANCRFSGMGLSVTTGHAFIGGSTPLVGSYLIDIMQSKLAVSFWIIGLCSLVILLIKLEGPNKYLKF